MKTLASAIGIFISWFLIVSVISAIIRVLGLLAAPGLDQQIVTIVSVLFAIVGGTVITRKLMKKGIFGDQWSTQK